MWLTNKNRILTLDNLLKKGWQGDNTCHFCDQLETKDHLFVTCSFTKQIWFFMGSCQQASIHWTKFSDIIHFAKQLPPPQKAAMLLVFSAVCWTIWKHRNELCFASGKRKTTRQIILLIISLVHYWAGQVKPQVQECMSLWLPVDTDAIPLASWHPDDAALDQPAETSSPELGYQLVLYGEAQQ